MKIQQTEKNFPPVLLLIIFISLDTRKGLSFWLGKLMQKALPGDGKDPPLGGEKEFSTAGERVIFPLEELETLCLKAILFKSAAIYALILGKS